MDDHQSTTSRFVGNDKRWVGAQVALQAVAVFGGPVELLVSGRNVSIPTIPAVIGGVALIGLAMWVFSSAAKTLGDNLTASPTPVPDGHLVDTGIYGQVRHPMYLSLLLGVLGLGLLLGSLLVVAIAVIFVPFLMLKTHHEERKLLATYPDYADYRGRVRRRFIPYIL